MAKHEFDDKINGVGMRSNENGELPPLNCTATIRVATFTDKERNVFIVPGVWTVQDEDQPQAELAASAIATMSNSEVKWQDFPNDPVEEAIDLPLAVRGKLGWMDILVIGGPRWDKIALAASVDAVMA